MFRLLFLLFRAAPYMILLLTPFSVLFSVGYQFVDVPQTPTVMPIRDVQGLENSLLPEWVRTEDGILLWAASMETYTINPIVQKISDTMDNRELKDVYVPLVSRADVEAWSEDKSFTGLSSRCVLVHYDSDEIRRDFPEYLAFRLNNSDPFGSKLFLDSSPSPMSFTTSDNDSDVHFGMERDVVDQFLQQGFRDVMVVRAGSKPLSKAEAAIQAIVWVMLAGGSLLWIRKRRRKAAAEAAAEEQRAEAALEGIRAGIRAAVRDALAAQSAGRGDG